jgi:hypothetical protein
MQSRFWIRILLVGGILASVSYAWRVWKASASTQFALTVLLFVSIAVLLAVAAMLVPHRQSKLGWVALPAFLGVLTVVCATLIEFTSGVAEAVRLKPGASTELGSAKVTLTGFCASYGSGGAPTSWESDLVVDLADRAESLKVVSGRLGRVNDIKIFQLGFGLDGSELYSELGLLENNAYWPFVGGLSLLSVGAAISVVTARR